jgi:hypothetical protein
VIEDLFPHAEIVPDAIAAGRRVNVTGFSRYALLDRGSYEVAPFTDDELLGELCQLVGRRLDRALVPVEARVIRLCAGDYLLARHDVVRDTRLVEIVLDLSPAPVDAELHYRRRGGVFFRVPCAPRSLAIVERTPLVTCNHTYVSKRWANAEVTRLIVLLDLRR